MAVYEGQVSYKNGLGKVKNVTATDDLTFAMAFGISGNLGQVYSNQKIGMLQLEGDTKQKEIAVDPSEMTRMEGLDYARAHSSEIVDYGLLANSLMITNRTEMASKLNSITPMAEMDSLSNEARGEVAKLVLGVGDENVAKVVILTDNHEQALLDTIKRTATMVHYQQVGNTAGIEFVVSAKGTTAVQVNPSSKLIKVIISMDGYVAGSASSAGAKYKQIFVDVKNRVTEVGKNEELDRSVRYDANDDIESIAGNVYAMLVQTARQLVRKEVKSIEDKFSDFEDFNPASAKAKLWKELNLSSSEISQSGLDENALKSYASGEISAFEFASMPENGLVSKLTKAVEKRLKKANYEAFQQRIIESLEIDPSKVDSEIEKKVRNELEKTIDLLVEQILGTTGYGEAYELYSRSNKLWETQIIDIVLKNISYEDTSNDHKNENAAQLDTIVSRILYDNLLNLSEEAFTNIMEEKNLTDDMVVSYRDLPQKIAEQQTTLSKSEFFTEQLGITEDNVGDLLNEYINNNYNYDFIYINVLHKFKLTDVQEIAKSQLINLVAMTTPYSEAPKSYWIEAVNRVGTLKELAGFVKEQNVDEFINKYADDWKESTN